MEILTTALYGFPDNLHDSNWLSTMED